MSLEKLNLPTQHHNVLQRWLTSLEAIPKVDVVCGNDDQPKRTMLQLVGLELKRCRFTCAIKTSNTAEEDRDDSIQVCVAISEEAAALGELLGRADRQVAELENERMTVLVSSINGKICGALIALVVPTPPVYDAGGDTCLVTELAVPSSSHEDQVCRALLDTIGHSARKKNAVQFVVPCDSANEHNQALLTEYGMTIASEWYRGGI